MTPKNILLTFSRKPMRGALYLSFMAATEKPSSTEISSTWRMSPSVKALNMVLGIIFSRWSVTVMCCAWAT